MEANLTAAESVVISDAEVDAPRANRWTKPWLDRPTRSGRLTRGSSVASPKQLAREILETLPDDCSLEEISYHLYVRARVEEGLRDLDEGRVVPHDQVMRGAAEWLMKRKA